MRIMTDRPNQTAKILVIDDNQTVLFATRQILEEAGFEVVTTDRSIGASAIVIREEPDLVLMDLEMPLRGSAIVKIMRANSMLKDTKVVLYSGRPLEELQAATERCGADGYIEKSSGADVLISAVKGYLGTDLKCDTQRST
jgi:DNA-binding response OmpR family regulator